MRWPLAAIAVSFVALFGMIGTAWMMCVSEAAIVGPPPPPAQLVVPRQVVPLPETLTAEEILDLIRPWKSLSLGCGDCDRGEKSFECWWNSYANVTVPWWEEPVEVQAGYTYEGLISFRMKDVEYDCGPGEKILKRRTE